MYGYGVYKICKTENYGRRNYGNRNCHKRFCNGSAVYRTRRIDYFGARYTVALRLVHDYHVYHTDNGTHGNAYGRCRIRVNGTHSLGFGRAYLSEHLSTRLKLRITVCYGQLCRSNTEYHFPYCLYNLRDGCGVHIAKSVIVSAIYRHHTAEEYGRSYGNNGGDDFICLCYKSIRICKNEKKHRAQDTRKRKQPCRHAKNHTHIAVSAESHVLRHHF